MHAVGITILFFVLLLGFGVYVVQVVPAKIESSISNEIKQKFEANNLSQINVSIDGRDVTLSGAVDSQAEIGLAMKLASRNAGVRAVMTSMTLVADDLMPDKDQSSSTNHPQDK